MDKAASDSSETQRLLQAVRAGEPEALSRLFARHRDYLRKVIDMRLDARLRRRVDASDLVQETQIEAARRIEAYVKQPPMPFRLWLRKTARDRLNKARRRHVEAGRRSLDRELTLPDRSSLQLASRCLGKASTPSLHARRHELAGRIRQSIATLPEADREIILMLDFEGLSSRDAVYVLNLDSSTVHRRHGRALLRLQKSLRDRGVTGSQP